MAGLKKHSMQLPELRSNLKYHHQGRISFKRGADQFMAYIIGDIVYDGAFLRIYCDSFYMLAKGEWVPFGGKPSMIKMLDIEAWKHEDDTIKIISPTSNPSEITLYPTTYLEEIPI